MDEDLERERERLTRAWEKVSNVGVRVAMNARRIEDPELLELLNQRLEDMAAELEQLLPR
jgi:hypothetical protein